MEEGHEGRPGSRNVLMSARPPQRQTPGGSRLRPLGPRTRRAGIHCLAFPFFSLGGDSPVQRVFPLINRQYLWERPQTRSGHSYPRASEVGFSFCFKLKLGFYKKWGQKSQWLQWTRRWQSSSEGSGPRRPVACRRQDPSSPCHPQVLTWPQGWAWVLLSPCCSPWDVINLLQLILGWYDFTHPEHTDLSSCKWAYKVQSLAF